jgi:uncharacterized protein YbaP (TraB family)
MHIRDERAHQLCESLYPLIQHSDVFIGEMDMEMSMTSMQTIPYDILSFMTAKGYDKLHHQILKTFRIDLNEYRHMHPLIVMSAISNSVLQSEHFVSLDEQLWNFAKENGKKMAGLESYEEQFRILHSIAPLPLYKQLKNIGRNPSGVRKHTIRGLRLYIPGRIHELYSLSKSSMHDLRKKIIYQRNERMIDVIKHLDLQLKYFITVGAGHLSGKTGIISQLRKAGYKVKPFKI